MSTSSFTPSPSLIERTTPNFSSFELAMVAISRKTKVGLPGIIQTFDSQTLLASVQLAVLDIAPSAQDPDSSASTTKKGTILQDVLVVLPHGGGFAVTFPLTAGDECLLHFADLNIDDWWQSGSVSKPFSSRRHDLSDAFCVPGPWSKPNVLSNYSTNAMELRSEDGTVSISISSDSIVLTASTVTVNADNVTVMANDNVTVSGDTVNVTGSQSVTINGNNMTSIDGLNWKNHFHMVGSSVSGPPQG